MATVRFGDVAERVNTKEDRLNTDLVYYVGGEHIESNALTVSGRGKIKEADLGPMFYFGFKPGDILFVTRNPHLRKCATVDFSGICSEKTLVIGTKDEDVLSQKYLATVMQSDDFWEFMEENKSGSVNYFINWSTLADYEFDLPSIARQRELANLLWAANDLKESYKKAITATDEMLKAKFREMFGEVGDASRRAAESRSEGYRAKSSAGEEQNVKMVKLKEITQGFRNGLSPSRRGDIHAKVLTLTAITQGTFDASQWKDATFDDVPAIDKYISESDFYICRGNGNKSLVGVGVAAPSDYEDLVFPDTMIAVKIDQQVIDLKFLAFAWKSISVRKQIESIAKTTNGIYKINQEGLGGVAIPLPPLSLQREFVAIAERADAAKSALKQSIADIDQVMKGLING